MLTNQRLTDHPGLLEHLMGRLKHPLQMGRVALSERELFAQAVE